MNENQTNQSDANNNPNFVLDDLCFFYEHMTVEALRREGYKIRISHYRYTPETVNLMRACKMAIDPGYLAPMHQLRASFELAYENEPDRANYNYISSHGGKTVLELLPPDETDQSKAIVVEAWCSVKDVYNRKKGVLICLGRAFNALCKQHGFTKQDVIKAIAQFNRFPEHIEQLV